VRWEMKPSFDDA